MEKFMSFRTIGKIGFLFVIIGFLMPIACDQNGFEIAKDMMEYEEIFSGILLYILFISAIIGCIIGISLAQKKDVSASFQWAVIIICIMSGLIVYFSHLEGLDLQSGAYIILTGWIISLISQFFPNENNTGFGCIEGINSAESYTDISAHGQVGEIYTVIAQTAIRVKPDENGYAKKTLKVGDKVYFQNVLEDTPDWFYVDTSDKKDGGWCFAGHIKKG